MNDSRGFEDAESVRSGLSHVPVNQRGHVDGVAKASAEQAAADSRGSRSCVCANTFDLGVAHAGGRKDELTSCRSTV